MDPLEIDYRFRARISDAVSRVLRPLPDVLAGWEGGSAAFGALDGYSDIDLNYLVAEHAATDLLYTLAEESLKSVSPITATHPSPPGRYYHLEHAGEFLLVDLCIVRADAPERFLGVERHGAAVPLFDKGNWLDARLDDRAIATRRAIRYRELRTWFPMSQGFVWKAIRRGRHVEAVAAYWAYTLKPLAELLRMRHCPVRWDFGMRYLDRDLPPDAYRQFQDLTFVRDLGDVEAKLATASTWGRTLVGELESASVDDTATTIL